SLPNKYLKATADDAPETASERRFGGNTTATIDPVTGRRQGLGSAIKRTRKRRGLRALLSR
ncbi:acyl-CoA desaturase, partial [Rhodococcus koreensis]